MDFYSSLDAETGTSIPLNHALLALLAASPA